jgi:hypothetical protein
VTLVNPVIPDARFRVWGSGFRVQGLAVIPDARSRV